jgi:peptidyl-prolyl cis-trans isomerase B (cyclophilin B)
MSRHRAFARAVIGSLVLAGLLAAPAVAQDTIAPVLGPPAAQPLTHPPVDPGGDGSGVRLSTDLGDIVIGLYTSSAPVASENFRNLVAAGFYDGVDFHRVVPGFLIQGGDPGDTGSGGPGYAIPDEPVVGRYVRGTVAMARTEEPDSGGSQFFIVLEDDAESRFESDRTYAIFGHVVEGMDVVDAIAATPNSGGPDNLALEPVVIRAATLERVELPEPDEAEPVPTDEGDDEPIEELAPTPEPPMPLGEDRAFQRRALRACQRARSRDLYGTRNRRIARSAADGMDGAHLVLVEFRDLGGSRRREPRLVQDDVYDLAEYVPRPPFVVDTATDVDVVVCFALRATRRESWQNTTTGALHTIDATDVILWAVDPSNGRRIGRPWLHRPPKPGSGRNWIMFGEGGPGIRPPPVADIVSDIEKLLGR